MWIAYLKMKYRFVTFVLRLVVHGSTVWECIWPIRLVRYRLDQLNIYHNDNHKKIIKMHRLPCVIFFPDGVKVGRGDAQRSTGLGYIPLNNTTCFGHSAKLCTGQCALNTGQQYERYWRRCLILNIYNFVDDILLRYEKVCKSPPLKFAGRKT